MMNDLRKISDSWIGKVMMFILIFSFVGWGVASYIFGEGSMDDAIVRVGRDKISYAQYENERQGQLQRQDKDAQKQIYGSPDAMRAFGQSILSRLTVQSALSQRAAKLGFLLSEAEVARMIKQEPVFQDKGKFAEWKFDAVLQANGLTEDMFANIIRNDRTRDMVGATFMTGAPVPEFAGVAEYNARYAQKKISYARVPLPMIKAAPTDAQLREIYTAAPKMIPEYRTVSYVLLPVNMSQPDAYDRGYERAKKMQDAIVGGETLAAAAAKFGAKMTRLAPMAAGAKATDPVVLAEPQIFDLQQGDDTDLIETRTGFAIAHIDKIEAEHATSFESMRNDLTAVWRENERKKIAYVAANEKLVDLNAGKKTAMTAATVTRTSGAPMAVLNAAFASPNGTKMLVPGADAIYVLSVGETIKPKADAKKLADLRKESANMFARILADDYTAFLSRTYPVKLNERLFKRVFGE